MRMAVPVPPPDGRQSETALMIARGARRMLRALGYSTLTEMALPSGRRADIVALAPGGWLHVVEIKSSVADLRADSKWQDYRAHCDALYFAVGDNVLAGLIPADAGLILADAYGAAVLRSAPEHRLAPATRKAMLVRFAQVAADRLHGLGDPDFGM